ncbi:hemolysin family protein [Persicobacter sp. CCB-QB2]|uniref:hemolysin family protein n=1 Tax=Persicobacter sp. CCB-QB2 TaxID=1561025 RepID=UPI0006A9F245|nr:hemolysin family protein [Persicobacter sp. CCB-QB2]
MIESLEQPIYIVVISLLASALFSGVEIAFISADKLQFQLDEKKGMLSGKVYTKFLKSPSQFVATMLVGNTVTLMVYTIFMAKVIEGFNSVYHFLPEDNEFLLFFLQTVISTVIVLFLSEFTPKSLFLIDPNGILKVLMVPVWLIYQLSRPVVAMVMFVSELFIVHVMRLPYSEDSGMLGRTELSQFVSNLKEGYEEEQEVDSRIINNALEFKTVQVRDCMVPRTDIVAVEENAAVEDLKNAFMESGHSKILVYRDSVDDIIGYCHSSDLFRKPKSVKENMMDIPIVTETMLANDLLLQFVSDQKSIAVVVDEFGGTAGIVSVEDVIEEILGEIQDEHDDEDLVEEEIGEEHYRLSARLDIDYLNEKYDWDIPEGDYDTLGGFIFAEAQKIPEEKEEIFTSIGLVIIEIRKENGIDIVQLDRSNLED